MSQFGAYFTDHPVYGVGMELFKGHLCSHYDKCEKTEFSLCGALYCPEEAMEHFWHDGCPACMEKVGVEEYLSGETILKEGL